MSKNIIFVIIFIFCLNLSFAYERHEPILIKNIHATAEEPYIIEGYEISSDSANCIEVIDSKHVIIRNNYLHHCNWSKKEEGPLSWTQGRAVFVKDSEDIIIENNTLSDNKIGIFVYKTQRTKVLHNDITKTQVVGSLKLEHSDDSEIAYNYLIDNGRPDWFWVPGNRIIGIWVAASHRVDIHDNTVIRSSSDGIGISGTIDSSLEEPGKRDWKMTADNIRVYNNVLLDNLELGIWLARIKNMECYNNTIRDHFGPIVLDFDVQDSEFHHNKLVSWGGPPIGIGTAKNNHIHDNIWYSIEREKFNAPRGDKPGANDVKFAWSGIDPYVSSHNIFENNEVRQIGGSLKEQLISKRNRAEEEGIFKEKGWFACEIEEGLLDKECVAREEAKGNQGMPRELFVFEPLMNDFDKYVDEKYSIFSSDKKEESNLTQDGCEVCNYTAEKIYAMLFFLTLLLFIVVVVLYFKKK